MGTVGTDDQRNRGHRELVVQWKSRNRGSVIIAHKGPKEQWAPWAQRTRGTEGIEN